MEPCRGGVFVGLAAALVGIALIGCGSSKTIITVEKQTVTVTATTTETVTGTAAPSGIKNCGIVPSYPSTAASLVLAVGVDCQTARTVAGDTYANKGTVNTTGPYQFTVDGYQCAESVHQLILNCSEHGRHVYASPPGLMSAVGR